MNVVKVQRSLDADDGRVKQDVSNEKVRLDVTIVKRLDWMSQQ